MKKMKSNFWFVLVLVLASCGAKNGSSNAWVSGVIKNSNGDMVYLEQLTTEKIILLDSAKTDKDGNFSFKKSTAGTDYYRIRIGKELPLNNYAPPANIIVFITDSTEKIKLEAELKNDSAGMAILPGYKISGSRESGFLMEMNAYLFKGEGTIDSLNQLFQKDPEHFDQVAAQNIYNNIQLEREVYMKKFAADHINDFVAMQALPFINPENNFDVYKSVSESLTKKFPTNSWVINLQSRVLQLSQLAIGTPAPDFTVKTPDDKNVSLHDFKGKYVLLDFWASWCRPCREENPTVVAAYNKFKSKGFTVFSVSLDQQKEAWVQAIKDDGMPWSHGSDLLYWDAAPAKLYNVQQIPMNFLIDKEGNIVAKNLRGPDLEMKLAEVLK